MKENDKMNEFFFFFVNESKTLLHFDKEISRVRIHQYGEYFFMKRACLFPLVPCV